MVGTSGKVAEGAERSLTVHYANYKEDIILKKNMDILNRTEKNIVHRVKIDQKILYKRFQEKLHRSKLAYARMYGDKEKERELRAKNLRSLNINVGDSERDYEFLKKLQTTDTPKKKKVPKVKINIDAIIDDVFPNEQTPRQRSHSLSEGNSLPIPDKTKGITVRPSSAKYGRPEERTACVAATTKNLLQVPAIDARPRTCSPILTGLGSRRPSSKNGNGDKTQRKSSNLFESEEREDLVEMRLKELKSLDFSDKIENFHDSIENYKSVQNGSTDYYNMRLEAAPKVKVIEDIPGTPDEQYQKHYGDLGVRSLTMKRLNFDFSKHVSQSHLFTPDASAMLRYESSDESSSDESDA